MTTTRVQQNRFSTTGARPTSGGRRGELYINSADQQFGYMANIGSPVDLLAVRFFSITATYAVGDHVVHNQKLYRCVLAVTTAGAFAPANWIELGAGGTGTGGAFVASPTAPTTPSVGDHWLDTVQDILYIRATDNVSTFWLDISSSSGGSTTVPAHVHAATDITTGVLAPQRGGSGLGAPAVADQIMMSGTLGDYNLRDIVGTGGITITHSPTTLTIGVVGGPTGNVQGPASAIDQRIAVFDGATGKLIEDGGYSVADLFAAFAPMSHTHTMAQVTGLGTMASQDAAAVAITGGTLTGVTLVNPVIPQASVPAQKSIINSVAGGLQLEGDVAAPGSTKYYGTDALGTKGFYSFSSAPTGGLIETRAVANASLQEIFTNLGDYAVLEFDLIGIGSTNIRSRVSTTNGTTWLGSVNTYASSSTVTLTYNASFWTLPDDTGTYQLLNFNQPRALLGRGTSLKTASIANMSLGFNGTTARDALIFFTGTGSFTGGRIILRGWKS